MLASSPRGFSHVSVMNSGSIPLSLTNVDKSARFSEEPTDCALNNAIRKPAVVD